MKMITTASDIVELLSVNFGFDIIENDLFEEILLLDPMEAFEFSLITGANYLISSVGYSFKGRMEVSIHRSLFQNGGFIYTPGLFSRDQSGFLRPGESVKEQYKKYPQLFIGFKKLIIINVSDNSCIEEMLYDKIKNSGKDPSDYIVYKSFNNGSNNEPLLEYFASKFFSKNGLMTENQAPWFNQNYIYDGKKINGGIPDFSAFSCEDLYLVSESLNLNHMNIQTTSAIFLKEKSGHKIDTSNYHLILGEAKTTKGSLSSALAQLDKYSSTALPNELYLIIPDLYDYSSEEYGVLNIDLNNQIVLKTPTKIKAVDTGSQQIDAKWISNITKMYLLSNLDFEDIILFITKNMGLTNSSSITSKELVTSINKSSMNEIIDFVTDRIQYLGVW